METEYEKWEADQGISPCSPEAYYAEKAWQDSRKQLISELRKLEWPRSVLQEAIDAAGVELLPRSAIPSVSARQPSWPGVAMTIDKQKLKVLAQAVADSEDQPELEAEHAEAQDALWLHMHCHTILALLAEIERLEMDNGSMRGSTKRMGEDASKAQRQARKQQREIDQLKAENEALRKDADRYRWLRKQPNDCSAPRIDICYWSRNGDDSVNEGDGLRLLEADVAIDSAMRSEAKRDGN